MLTLLAPLLAPPSLLLSLIAFLLALIVFSPAHQMISHQRWLFFCLLRLHFACTTGFFFFYYIACFFCLYLCFFAHTSVFFLALLAFFLAPCVSACFFAKWRNHFLPFCRLDLLFSCAFTSLYEGLSIHPFVRPPICICPSICLSVRSCICLSVLPQVRNAFSKTSARRIW